MAQSHLLSNTRILVRGQLLIELLVALAIAAVLIPALVAGFVATRQGRAQGQQRLEATTIAKEMAEAVRVIREAGWNNIATNGTYHPVIAGATWSLAAGSIESNGYTESVTIADGLRDATGTIVLTGGVPDPSTKKISVTVSWGTPIPSAVTNLFYLTRLDNISWIQTSQADFDAGVKTNVITTNVSGGEVELGLGNIGRADWCKPNLSIAATDLPKQGVANAISAIEGHVFAGTGDNASGVSYATVNITNTNPPGATVVGTYDGYKTNGIFGEPSYAYLATDNNFKEIEIINLTTNPYSEAGYFDASGNGNGNSIYVAGNIGYMTNGNVFRTFDLTIRLGSRPQLGSTTLAGTGVKTVVIGSYAYVAINSTPTQLQILDVSNPASPTVIGQAQVNGAAGVDVYVEPTATRAYLATSVSATKPEFFVIDITTKTGNRPVIGTYDSNGMDPRGITVMPGNRALLVGAGGEEYQALNITNESNPVRCGGLNIDTGVHGVATVLEEDGDAYSYIITGDATSELKIIEGGPGGKYALTGTFESSIFDASVSSAFNRFVPNAILPANTTLAYQVAGADAVLDSCTNATFVFVGPDATGATKFSTGSAIPISSGPGYKNPARCFRYKVFFTTTDPTVSPILTDMIINYSP